MRRRALALVLSCAACARPAPPPPPSPAPPAPAPSATEQAEARALRAIAGARDLVSTGDLDEIKQRGVLRVLTRNDSTSYFLYRGVESGFQYELAKMLATELGVRVEMVVPRATRDLIPWLLQGRGDIVMSDLSPESPRADRTAWTRPYLETELVVVMTVDDAAEVTSLKQLNGKRLAVRPSSAAVKRMRALLKSEELNIKLMATREAMEPEDLLDLVEYGLADAAVVTSRSAQADLLHSDELTIAFVLDGPPFTSSLGVRKDNPRLLAAADAFVKRHYRGKIFNILYRRYYESRAHAVRVRDVTVRADLNGQLTPWDGEFRRAGLENGLDWRLLVAVAVQESNLDPNARSPMGAVGLMQMLPSTARSVGVDDPFDPVQSIHGGARYLARVREAFAGQDISPADQLWFALASYNAGIGHVEDARVLAGVAGKDADVWFDNVEEAILLLEKPRYYLNTRSGYCRGSEPKNYVAEIQLRFDAYVKLTDPKAHPALDP